MAKKARSAAGKGKGSRGGKGASGGPTTSARAGGKTKASGSKGVGKPARGAGAKGAKVAAAMKPGRAVAAKKGVGKVSAKKAEVVEAGAASAETGAKKVSRRSGGATAKPAAGTSLKVAGISNAAVHQATGKGWTEWLSILDRAGAADRDHRGIVALVAEHGVGDWWSQQVTVGYEQARGKREANQAADGFQVSVSKTIAAPAPKLYAAFMEPTLRDRWLSGSPIEVRSSKDDKSVRATWTTPGHDEGTSVEATFDARDGGRTMVRIDHRRLADAEAVKRSRVYWASRLENLRAILERPATS